MSGGASEDKSFGKDRFSGGSCKDESCREDVMSHGGRMCLELFSADVFKEKSCGKDVFSGGACKDQTPAVRLCLAEVLARIRHLR